MDADRFAQFINDAMEHRPIEARVLRKVVKALEDAGTPVVKVWDTEEYVPVATLREIQEQVFNLDESWLITESGAWVRFTMGNEWDVISDYTLSLEEALEPVNDYIAENGY